MKIAHVTAFYTPAIGGVKQVVEELAERYVKKGHEVHVYCSDSDKCKRIPVKEETIKGVHVHRCSNWFTIANFATFWPSILRKLWKEDFDIIHTHVSGHSYVFFAALIAKLRKIPHVHTTHCPWTEGYRSLLGRLMLKLVYPTLMRLSLKWASKIIAITPWELKFIEKYGGRKDKIKVIPNGMDNILLRKVENNDFRNKLKIKKEDKIVLFFGRFNPTKAPDKLVLAGREILKERKDVYFIFRGPDEGVKQKVANMIKNEEHMILMEPTRDKKEIAKMYQAADVYALPSYREGLPLTLFEAMASGLPIVATPVNGVPYEMLEPDNGFLVPYGNIKALKEKILLILDDKNLAKKISENNKKRAKDYDWDKIAERTFKIYIKIQK
ncbi:MAG: glycosyltransferase family 4 protein [Nanoarchaeota archaeon]|nr:glycosyltransferase family 4 protein [Nanoarchaeota archaeon]